MPDERKQRSLIWFLGELRM